MKGNHYIFALLHGKYLSQKCKPCIGEFPEGIIHHHNGEGLCKDRVIVQAEESFIVSCIVVSPEHKYIFFGYGFREGTYIFIVPFIPNRNHIARNENHILLRCLLQRACVRLHHNSAQPFASRVSNHCK